MLCYEIPSVARDTIRVAAAGKLGKYRHFCVVRKLWLLSGAHESWQLSVFSVCDREKRSVRAFPLQIKTHGWHIHTAKPGIIHFIRKTSSEIVTQPHTHTLGFLV